MQARVRVQARVVVQKVSAASAVAHRLVAVAVQRIRVAVKAVASVTVIASVQQVMHRVQPHVTTMITVATVLMHRVASSHAVTVHGDVMLRRVTATAAIVHLHPVHRVNMLRQTAVQTVHVVTTKVQVLLVKAHRVRPLLHQLPLVQNAMSVLVAKSVVWRQTVMSSVVNTKTNF
jgi:hypothetical protein